MLLTRSVYWCRNSKLISAFGVSYVSGIFVSIRFVLWDSYIVSRTYLICKKYIII